MEQISDINAVIGYYYVHENGDLIYKTADAGMEADLRESTFVKAYWPLDLCSRENAWTVAVEALACNALPGRVKELAEQWGLTNEDAQIYAKRVGCVIVLDGNQWCATRMDFLNLQQSPAGFGNTALDAMAQLALVLGFKANKPQRRGFKLLLR